MKSAIRLIIVSLACSCSNFSIVCGGKYDECPKAGRHYITEHVKIATVSGAGTCIWVIPKALMISIYIEDINLDESNGVCVEEYVKFENKTICGKTRDLAKRNYTFYEVSNEGLMITLTVRKNGSFSFSYRSSNVTPVVEKTYNQNENTLNKNDKSWIAIIVVPVVIIILAVTTFCMMKIKTIKRRRQLYAETASDSSKRSHDFRYTPTNARKRSANEPAVNHDQVTFITTNNPSEPKVFFRNNPMQDFTEEEFHRDERMFLPSLPPPRSPPPPPYITRRMASDNDLRPLTKNFRQQHPYTPPVIRSISHNSTPENGGLYFQREHLCNNNWRFYGQARRQTSLEEPLHTRIIRLKSSPSCYVGSQSPSLFLKNEANMTSIYETPIKVDEKTTVKRRSSADDIISHPVGYCAMNPIKQKTELK